MSNITCFDSDGKLLKVLYQWDSDQTVSIPVYASGGTPVFHFCNRSSDQAYAVEPTLSGLRLTAKIPNILLQQAEPIIIYLYAEVSAERGRTLDMVSIPVIPRARPSDYYYVDDTPEYIRTIQGKSAYELAVDYGYTGTEEQWVEDLEYHRPRILLHNGTVPTVSGMTGNVSSEFLFPEEDIREGDLIVGTNWYMSTVVSVGEYVYGHALVSTVSNGVAFDVAQGHRVQFRIVNATISDQEDTVQNVQTADISPDQAPMIGDIVMGTNYYTAVITGFSTDLDGDALTNLRATGVRFMVDTSQQQLRMVNAAVSEQEYDTHIVEIADISPDENIQIGDVLLGTNRFTAVVTGFSTGQDGEQFATIEATGVHFVSDREPGWNDVTAAYTSSGLNYAAFIGTLNDVGKYTFVVGDSRFFVRVEQSPGNDGIVIKIVYDVSGDVSSSMKIYVDNVVAGELSIDQPSKQILLRGLATPYRDDDAANKAYVDSTKPLFCVISSANHTCDKTNAQIYAAHSAGRIVKATIDNTYVAELRICQQAYAAFEAGYFAAGNEQATVWAEISNNTVSVVTV